MQIVNYAYVYSHLVIIYAHSIELPIYARH